MEPSSGLCALRPKNKYFKEFNFASWVIPAWVKSGTVTVRDLCVGPAKPKKHLNLKFMSILLIAAFL